MIKNSLNNKGETLAETIIALSILAITITMASTVIMNSMRNLSSSKQRIVAVSIAREGIEAVRGIRDSNWLLYSDRRRQCWNHDPGLAAAAVICDPAAPTPIEPGTYIVYKHDPEGSWRLELADNALGIDSDGDAIPDNDLDLAPLSLVDIDAFGIDSDGDGDFANDNDMYNHALATNFFGVEAKTTPFLRYVVIEYMENQPGANSAITPPNDAINTVPEWNNAGVLQSELNRMRITSVVEWQRRGNYYSVELKTIITDHLGRKDINS